MSAAGEAARLETGGRGITRLNVLVPDDYGGRVRDPECARRYPQFDLEFVPGPAVDRRGFIGHLARADALITRIATLHSYDVPCVATWPIDKIFAPYADWVEDSVG